MMNQTEKKLERIQKMLDRLQAAVSDLKRDCATPPAAHNDEPPLSLAPLIEQLQRAFDAQSSKAMPLANDLWDVATIAKYLKRNEASVRERITPLPSFPKAIRLPSKSGVGRPLYKATEVIAWVEKHKEKR